MLPTPSTSTLFPYTTLFRSHVEPRAHTALEWFRQRQPQSQPATNWSLLDAVQWLPARAGVGAELLGARSEEHTSELQSHVKLVCRLLLEKKKTANHFNHSYL